jgi:hypothetical protein
MKLNRVTHVLALCITLSSIACSGSEPTRNAILQKDRGERLGDRLLIICAVKFLALMHGDLDFYYQDSQFLDNYMLSDTETKIDDTIKARYARSVPFSESGYKFSKPPTLFLAPWSCIDDFCAYFGKRHLYREHFKKLQQMLQPKVILPIVEAEPDAISVAVHIRKGEGYDTPLSSAQIYKNVDQIYWGEKYQSKKHGSPADRSWPDKFPPEQYYIDAIRILEELLPDKKIAFYIFTDCRNTQALTERIATYCTKDNVTFINATSPSSDSPMVDMNRIASCKCLIRPQSAYSIVSQIKGDPMIVFSPLSCEWHNNILYVTRIRLHLFNSTANKAMECTYEQCDKNLLRQWITELFYDTPVAH